MLKKNITNNTDNAVRKYLGAILCGLEADTKMLRIVRRTTDEIHLFLAEQGARIIAESSQPHPCDRFHVGKHLLRGLKDAPDFIAQIDGGTGEFETQESLMMRSVRCAIALRNLGLKSGDAIVLMGPNHIHLAVPLYAAMYLGVAAAPVDRTLTIDELYDAFSLTEPKVVFCQAEKAEDVHAALKRLNVENPKIVTFNKGYYQSLDNFVEEYGDDTFVEDFIPSSIDTENTTAILVPTSGTTGRPKVSQLTHKNVMVAFPYMWSKLSNFPGATRMSLVVSHLQWITAIKNYFFSPIIRFTRLQSSLEMTPEHALSLINTYRPTYMILSPTLLIRLIEPEVIGYCDLTSFEIIVAAGSAVFKETIEKIKTISPNTDVFVAYGMTEASTYILDPQVSPVGTLGRRHGLFQYRLVDVVTNIDVTEPDKPGELWIKGAGVFKGYYKNPKATKDTFSDDGWLKTGDLMIRDENWNFFFVDRIKMLLKYRNHQISPVEIEGVIRRHAGVLDVIVTGVPSPDGDYPVACVVPRPGHHLTAHDIEQLVRDNLTDTKHLRGGVIFLDVLPTTSIGKVDRTKVKLLALQKNEK